MNVNVADEGYSRNVADEGYSRNVADEGYSRNVVDEGYSRNVVDEGYCRKASCTNYIPTFLLHKTVIKQRRVNVSQSKDVSPYKIHNLILWDGLYEQVYEMNNE